MRRTWYVSVLAAGLLAAGLVAAPAGASGGPLTVADAAGDANGLALLDVHQQTAPASLDAGDIRTLTVRTESRSGPDGPVPTALSVRLDLTGDPLSGPPLGFGLRAVLDRCESGFLANPQGGPSSPQTVRWYQHGQGCPGGDRPVPTMGTVETDDRWTLTTGPTWVELRIPFDALTPAQAAVLRPGAVLAQPAGVVTGYYSVRVVGDVHGQPGLVDATPTGPDWTIGSDLG